MADMYFQLIVIAVDGTEIVLKDVWKDLTVERFKKQISRQLGAYQTPPEDMLLQSMGMKLDDDRTLESYNLHEGSVIRIIDRNNPTAPTPILIPPPYTGSQDSPPAFPADVKFPLSKPMQTIFVKDPANTKTYTFQEIPLTMTVREFKAKMAEKLGNDVEEINIIYGGKSLTDKDHLTLMDLGMHNNCTLHLTFRLRGGM